MHLGMRIFTKVFADMRYVLGTLCSSFVKRIVFSALRESRTISASVTRCANRTSRESSKSAAGEGEVYVSKNVGLSCVLWYYSHNCWTSVFSTYKSSGFTTLLRYSSESSPETHIIAEWKKVQGTTGFLGIRPGGAVSPVPTVSYGPKTNPFLLSAFGGRGRPGPC